MELINEKNNSRIIHRLINHLPETRLKFTAIDSAGNEHAHIKSVDFFVQKNIRYVSLNNFFGQTLHDGSFTYAGISQKKRVVFGASANNLDYPLNFLVTANHRVDIFLSFRIGEMSGKKF